MKAKLWSDGTHFTQSQNSEGLYSTIGGRSGSVYKLLIELCLLLKALHIECVFFM